MRYNPGMRGFSLVELSIVLVILGLLTGGILAGQSLIRASELRAVTVEEQRYFTAVESFRDKYFAIPGDFNNATRFWGYLGGTGCTNNAGTAAVSTGVCDGNGTGVLDAGTTVSTTGESFQFWRQLASAGLIEGSYTGIAGPGTAWPGNDAVVGTNVPKSKMNNGGWCVNNQSNYVGQNWVYAADYGNYLEFGGQSTGTETNAPILKPEELWNIDTKIDDGKPGTGKVIAHEMGTFTGAAANKCTTSASQTDYTGAYNLGVSSFNCSVYFVKAAGGN